MDYASFRRSLNGDPPADGALVRALWHAWRGEWDAAHGIVQDQPGRDAAWIHALLHREEGDLTNAGYWYRRAGRDQPTDSTEAERERITRALLDG